MVRPIDDCAKDSGEEFFPSWIAFDSIVIGLKNAVHLGKKFLPAIFHAIVYYTC